VSETRPGFELPPELEGVHRRAVRLEWLTIVYLISAIVALFFTVGNSQAMRTAWIEDMLSLLPPAAFLIASRIRTRAPNERFPWGYHRSVSIAFLFAAVALLALGLLLFAEAATKLVTAEHPPIGTVVLFGEPVWLGWAMLAALAWTGIPAVLLGRVKLPLAAELHDKVLYADARMNKADWMTAAAAALGVLGIGIGLWWADAAAALVISGDIAHDGWRNVRAATSDLMDERARTYDSRSPHPLIEDMARALEECEWIREAFVRVREEGHVFHAEVFVVPGRQECLLEDLEAARKKLLALDWKLHDVVLAPVGRLPR
jgi:cation diffusion facilitator family transporter